MVGDVVVLCGLIDQAAHRLFDIQILADDDAVCRHAATDFIFIEGGDHLNIVAYFRIEQFNQKFFSLLLSSFCRTSASASVSILERMEAAFFDIHLFEVLGYVVGFSILKNIGQHVRVQNAVQFASLRNR